MIVIILLFARFYYWVNRIQIIKCSSSCNIVQLMTIIMVYEWVDDDNDETYIKLVLMMMKLLMLKNMSEVTIMINEKLSYDV